MSFTSPYFFDNVLKGDINIPPSKYVITRGVCKPISGHAFAAIRDNDVIEDPTAYGCYKTTKCNINQKKADFTDLISMSKTAKAVLEKENCFFGKRKLDILRNEKEFTYNCYVSADEACKSGFAEDDLGISPWEPNGEKCRGYTSCGGQTFEVVCRAVPPYRYHWQCERDALRPCADFNVIYEEAANAWDRLKSNNNIFNDPDIVYVTVITRAAGSTNKTDLRPAIMLFYISCESMINTGLTSIRINNKYTGDVNSDPLDSYIEDVIGPLQNGQVDTSKCFSFQIDIRDPIESLFCFLPKKSDICKTDPVTRQQINTCFPAGETGESKYLDTCTSFLANLEENNKVEKENAFTLMASYYPTVIANRCTFPDDDPAYQEMEGLASFANQPYSCWWRYCQNSNNTIFVKEVNRKISENCNVCICINSIDLENIDRSLLGDFTQVCSVECGGPDSKDGDGGDNGDNGDDNDEEEDNTTTIGGGKKNISNTKEFLNLLKENTAVIVILVIILILIIVGIISFAFTYRNPDSLKQLEVVNEKIKPTQVKSDTSKLFKTDKKIKTDIAKDNSKNKASNNSKKKDFLENKTLTIIRNVAIGITAIALITSIYLSYNEIVLDKPIISNRSFTSIEPPIKLDGNKVDEFNSFVENNQLFTAINTAYFYENDDVEFYLKRKLDLDDMKKLLDKLRKIFPNKKLVISAVNLVAESNQSSFFKQKVTVHKPGINGLYKPTEIKGQDIISNEVLLTQYQASVYN